MNSDNSLAEYIEGIAKASFCKPKCEQQYVSLAHFLSIQPRECMKVRDEYYPDMIVGSIKDIFGKSGDTRIAYIWLPTPPKKSSDQHKYVDACRRRMVEVLAKSQFDEIWLDVRGNIGGVLSTVIDAIYPILAKRLGEGVYLYGVDNKGKRVTTFEFHTQAGVSRHIIRPSDAYIPSGMAPVEPELADVFDNKPISILCNRYTMSTGEIICIIVRKIGGKIYGEKTRGLTNGMRIISGETTSGQRDVAKSVSVPYYSIADGDMIYRDGVKPDTYF